MSVEGDRIMVEAVKTITVNLDYDGVCKLKAISAETKEAGINSFKINTTSFSIKVKLFSQKGRFITRALVYDAIICEDKVVLSIEHGITFCATIEIKLDNTI